MNARTFLFSALDTWMFRDGRPFNQGDEGASAAQSVFPPPPPTLVGAVRLALAEQNGFDGSAQTWPAALGDGVNWQADKSQLGKLKFVAPLLVRPNAEGQTEPLFQAPLHLARAMKEATGENVLTLLLPRTEHETDIGKVKLPSAPDGLVGVKPCEGDFLTMAGIKAVLGGQPPKDDDVVNKDELWREESRVGIGRDISTRTARDGELYIAAHTRPNDGLALQLGVDGLEENVTFKPCLQRLGGEHRAAGIEAANPIPLPAAPGSLSKLDGGFVYAAIALSPVLFDKLPGPDAPVQGLEGTLMSACFGKPQMIGGWDSVKTKKPLAMRAVLPAGSVFFMTCDDEARALACHGRGAGKATDWGFGQVLIAKWSI